MFQSRTKIKLGTNIKLGTKMVNTFTKRENWRFCVFFFFRMWLWLVFYLINCIKIYILAEYAIIRLGDNS